METHLFLETQQELDLRIITKMMKLLFASQRPVIQTVFNVPFESVHEIDPGKAL
jgi:hypothetical protein